MSKPEGFEATYKAFCAQLSDETLPDKLAVLKALHEKLKAEVNAPICEQIKKLKDVIAELINKISQVDANSIKVEQAIKDKYAAEFAALNEQIAKLENAMEAEIELELTDNTALIESLKAQIASNEKEIDRLTEQKDTCLINC